MSLLRNLIAGKAQSRDYVIEGLSSNEKGEAVFTVRASPGRDLEIQVKRPSSVHTILEIVVPADRLIKFILDEAGGR